MSKTSKEFYADERELKREVIEAIRTELGNKKVVLDEFQDEANNTLVAIDKEQVYFNEGVDFYPLHDLGMLDAIYILSILEG